MSESVLKCLCGLPVDIDGYHRSARCLDGKDRIVGPWSIPLMRAALRLDALEAEIAALRKRVVSADRSDASADRSDAFSRAVRGYNRRYDSNVSAWRARGGR